MPAVEATSCAGDETGSNVASNVVGSPRRPWAMANDQNELVLSRWTMTSRFDHPSHRLGCDHCSVPNCVTASASRRRWRMTGSATSVGTPSSTTTGSPS
jgi:hypothetical protein